MEELTTCLCAVPVELINVSIFKGSLQTCPSSFKGVWSSISLLLKVGPCPSGIAIASYRLRHCHVSAIVEENSTAGAG